MDLNNRMSYEEAIKILNNHNITVNRISSFACTMTFPGGKQKNATDSLMIEYAKKIYHNDKRKEVLK